MIGKPIDAGGKKDTVSQGQDTVFGDLSKDRALLSTAVEQAGDIAKHYFRSNLKFWQKEPGQIVTEADIAIDHQLYDALMTERPGDGWLSEERPDDGSRQHCKRVWIIDPIDGTRSFAAGIPEFTISAALVIGGKPAVASVLNPITSEHFQATKGQGATLNGLPLLPSKQPNIAGASLLASSSEMKKRRWSEMMPDATFTKIGSLAYKLALIAAGRFSGLASLRSCNDWDIAAAALLLEESGAYLGDASGSPIKLNQSTVCHSGLVAAGNKLLYNELISHLAMICPSRA